MVCFRFISATLVAAVLLIAQLALPLAWLGHEALERLNDAALKLAVADGQKPRQPLDPHDESRCNVCQSVAAVRGQMSLPPAPFAIQIQRRVHESAAIRIIAARSSFVRILGNPRGPPAVA